MGDKVLFPWFEDGRRGKRLHPKSLVNEVTLSAPIDPSAVSVRSIDTVGSISKPFDMWGGPMEHQRVEGWPRLSNRN
jgi:hypothetical protein